MRMKSIYVGNLSHAVREDELRAVFAVYGRVSNVNMIREPESGQPRGFAFVEMANDGESDNAIAGLNGSDLDGRTLTVNEARPKGEQGRSRRKRPGRRFGT